MALALIKRKTSSCDHTALRFIYLFVKMFFFYIFLLSKEEVFSNSFVNNSLHFVYFVLLIPVYVLLKLKKQ